MCNNYSEKSGIKALLASVSLIASSSASALGIYEVYDKFFSIWLLRQ